MMFVLRMAWRETRASWTRLAFFFLCVGLGVAAIVVLRSVVQEVRDTLTGEARSLIGADLVVQSSRPLAADARTRIDQFIAAARATGTTEVVETQTMAAPEAGAGNGRVKLVELRAVEAPFPYYGTIELEGGKRYSHALLEHQGIVVEPSLLAALGVADGDRIQLAGKTFTIRGVILRDRVAGTGFALGPRIYLDLADLRELSLLGFGSRATYELLVRAPVSGLAGLESAIHGSIAREVASVQSWQTLEDRIGDNLKIAENYLSLVGFVVVVIGGIGVWSVTRVIVQQKLRSVAILKCLGATSGQVLGTYLIQILALSAGGSIVGLGIAAATLRLIPPSVLTALGVTRVAIHPSAIGQGVAVGLLVSLLFALVPLLDVRRVKPLLLLRATTAGTARVRSWESAGAGLAVSLALVGVAAWQAGSLRAGLFVCAGLAVIAAVLYGASRVLVRATGPLARSTNFSLRHAVINLGRPGNQTRVVLMAVGLGCFLILGVRAVEANLLTEFDSQVGRNSPDLVVIDIQRDQIDRVKAVAAPLSPDGQPPRVVPLMRARVTGVDGRRLHLLTADDVRRTPGLGREFGLTFRNALDPNEKVVEGTFWTSPIASPRTSDGADTEVSIEKQLHESTGIDVNDLVHFDMAGTPLSARVTSVRTVAWDNSQNGGFVFVLRPGPAVDRMPHNYVGFLQVRDDAKARGDVERDLVSALPNVSVIDVHDVLASIREVVNNATFAITIVGAVTLAGGGLILVGAVTMTKFQRLYETAIYRALGASTRMVVTMTAIEYGLVGLLAGALGAAGALALSWILARYLFHIDWQPAVGLVSSGCVIAAAAVAAVGLIGSLDVLVRKPLPTLRNE